MDYNIINESIRKCNLNKNLEIELSPDEDKIKQFLDTIKTFGQITFEKNQYKYKFRKCPKKHKR